MERDDKLVIQEFVWARELMGNTGSVWVVGSAGVVTPKTTYL